MDIDPQTIADLNRKLAALTTTQMLEWAVREFGEDLAFACSFSAEDMVLLDLLLKVQPTARVFVLDTGRLPQETCDLIERSRQHYGRTFQFYLPDTAALEAFLAKEGPNCFYRSIEARRTCCRIRKVEPLARALAGAKAWLTGMRRAQSVTRHDISLVEPDATHGGILKLNPLAGWSDTQVWDYIRQHSLPYNSLHDEGFPSIGCAPCTRAVQPGETADIRAGRWWWEPPEQKECGLHVENGKVVRNRSGK